MINLVADKINIISNQDKNSFNLTDKDEMIKETELDEIMGKLHRLPHGDTLVEVLKLIIEALLTHVHSYAGNPATIAGYVKETSTWLGKLDTILSEHVRIS